MQKQQEAELLAMFRRISNHAKRDFVLKTARRYGMEGATQKPALHLVVTRPPSADNHLLGIHSGIENNVASIGS